MEAIALIGPALASAGTWAAANAPVIGAGLSAAGSIYSGVRANQNAKLESQMLKKKGDDEFSIAARQARMKGREGTLALSRARAVAAASGAGTGDDTVTNIMADITAKRDTNVLTDLYRGDQSRADLYSEANVRRQEGRDALVGSFLDAGASIYGGVGRNRRSKREYEYED